MEKKRTVVFGIDDDREPGEDVSYCVITGEMIAEDFVKIAADAIGTAIGLCLACGCDTCRERAIKLLGGIRYFRGEECSAPIVKH